MNKKVIVISVIVALVLVVLGLVFLNITTENITVKKQSFCIYLKKPIYQSKTASIPTDLQGSISVIIP